MSSRTVRVPNGTEHGPVFSRQAKLRLYEKAAQLGLPDVLLAAPDLLIEALDVLTLLWPEPAVAFRMHVFEDRSVRDVASHLDVDADVAKSWIEARLCRACGLYVDDCYLLVAVLLREAEMSGGRASLLSCFHPTGIQSIEGLAVLFHHALFKGVLAAMFDDRVLKREGIDYDPLQAVARGLPWFTARARKVPNVLDASAGRNPRMLALIPLIDAAREVRSAVAALIAFLMTYRPDVWSRVLDVIADSEAEGRADRFIALIEGAGRRERHAIAGVACVMLPKSDRQRLGDVINDRRLGADDTHADVRMCASEAANPR